MVIPSQPSGSQRSEDTGLILNEDPSDANHRYPSTATPSGASLQSSDDLKAQYYQSAASSSAPALLELDREGYEPASRAAIVGFGPESAWQGQIQPVSASSVVRPESRESPAWRANADPQASPKQVGSFWQQQMQRDPDNRPGDSPKLLPSLRGTAASGHHAESSAGADPPTGATSRTLQLRFAIFPRSNTLSSLGAVHQRVVSGRIAK